MTKTNQVLQLVKTNITSFTYNTSAWQSDRPKDTCISIAMMLWQLKVKVLYSC